GAATFATTESHYWKKCTTASAGPGGSAWFQSVYLIRYIRESAILKLRLKIGARIRPATGDGTTMLLYDSFGPNPRAMRMFIAEKKIAIPTRVVDIMKAENRQAAYNERNPGGQLPALELDNGKCIGETVAIWDYLEEKNPSPALIGETPEDRAETHQWQRR